MATVFGEGLPHGRPMLESQKTTSKPWGDGGPMPIKHISSTHKRSELHYLNGFRHQALEGKATNLVHVRLACLHMGETLATVRQADTGSPDIACLNLGHIGGNDLPWQGLRQLFQHLRQRYHGTDTGRGTYM